MANRQNVLIVEDEHLIAMDISQTLVSYGYRVSEIANSAGSALEYLQRDTPDIALLDLNLGSHETSLGVAERLREIGCPIVFVSAYSRNSYDLPEDFADAPWVSKPFRESHLIGELGKITGPQNGTEPHGNGPLRDPRRV